MSGDRGLKSCKVCDHTIPKTRNRSWTQYQKKKYCSRECSQRAQSKKITKPCNACGEPITRSPSHMGRKVYCNRKCRSDGKTVNLVCGACGDEFSRPRSNTIDRRNGTAYESSYCSKACADRGMVKHGGVDQNRNSHEDLKWKKAVIEADGGRCRICGSDSNLEAHHIKHLSDRPDLRHDVDNGMCVCHYCHYYKIHGGAPAFINGKYMKPHPLGPFQLVLAL